MLEKIRNALDITSKDRDEDIKDCIASAYSDMSRVGIAILDGNGEPLLYVTQDPLIIAAVKLYARWQWNYEDAAERYERSYQKARDAIALCGDYHA